MNRDEFYDALYLAHHGVKGQKWGVRRYQNYDGTRIKSGEYARSMHQKASKIEPKITKDVTDAIKQSGASVYGLDHRLKTEESLSRKIQKYSSDKKIGLKEAAGSIKDAVRYTSVADDGNFVPSYNKTKRSLQDKGYSETECENYFDLYRQGKAKHKQINCIYEDADGNKFELQFHTPSSIKAKEIKTPLYEEARSKGVSPERKAVLVKQMEDLAKTVKDPKDVYSIKSHG